MQPIATSASQLPLVSICILSYNRKHKLAINLRKIRHHLNYPVGKIEVFVVENASSDGSADMVRHEFPWVKLIELPENTGVTGWNSAFAQAKGKYIIVLDDDAFLETNALQMAVKKAEADNGIGIIAFRIVSPTTGLEFTREYPTGNLSYWGCGALLRREMLEQIGHYDPQFFFQAFELDLSIRARVKNWTVAYLHEAIVYHMTTIGGQQSPQKFYYSRRNLIIVASKTFSLSNRIKVITRLAKITFEFGAGQSTRNKLRAIFHGIWMGWKSPANRLSASLQRKYRDNFCEFIAVGQQKQIWHDEKRNFWRAREEDYPSIFNIVDDSGLLRFEAGSFELDRYPDEKWPAIIGEKNWFGTHPSPNPMVDTLKIAFKGIDVDGQRLQGMVSLPDDRAAPVRGVVEIIHNGSAIARYEIHDLHDHARFDFPMPEVDDDAKVDIYFSAEMVDQQSPAYFCMVHWLDVKLTELPGPDALQVNVTEADGYYSYVARLPKNDRSLIDTSIVRHGDIIDNKERIENFEEFLDDLYLLEEIPPHEDRLGTLYLDLKQARVSKFFHDNADWRSVIISSGWLMTHPLVGQAPASVTVPNVEIASRVFRASLLTPFAKQPVIFTLRALRGKHVFREYNWEIEPGVVFEVEADMSDIEGIFDISLFCKMPAEAQNADHCSAHWIAPRFEQRRLVTRSTLPALTIVVHSLNVDGANGVILDVLKRPSFTAKFGEIRVISPVEGRLVEFLRHLSVHVSIVPEADSARRQKFLEKAFKKSDFVWVNTIDHSVELYQALLKANPKGMIFGHESMDDNSLVLPTTRWTPHIAKVLSEIRSLGRINLCWPSTSTVDQARRYLSDPSIALLPYGVDPTKIQRQPYSEQDMKTVRFFVGGWYCRRKNQDAIIPIFEEIERRVSAAGSNLRDYRITFCGTFFANYDYLEFMKSATMRLPASKLTFKAMVDNTEMRTLLASHHFLAVNALSEALPVTIMETMSNGGVVISSDVEGSEDLLDTDNAFVYPRQDYARAIEVFTEVLDPQKTPAVKLERMSASAIERMEAFSMDTYERRVFTMLGLKANGEDSLFERGYPIASTMQYERADWACVLMLSGGKLMTHPAHPAEGEESVAVTFENIRWRGNEAFSFSAEAVQPGRTDTIELVVTLSSKDMQPIEYLYQLSTTSPKARVVIDIPENFSGQLGAIAISARMAKGAIGNAYCSVIWSDLRFRAL